MQLPGGSWRRRRRTIGIVAVSPPPRSPGFFSQARRKETAFSILNWYSDRKQTLNKTPKRKWRFDQLIPICAPALGKSREIVKTSTRELNVVEGGCAADSRRKVLHHRFSMRRLRDGFVARRGRPSARASSITARNVDPATQRTNGRE